MALTSDEKLIRRKVVGTAIRLLREHIDLSQAQLARDLEDSADPMAISKWERAVVLPHPETREKLAAIARQHGRRDLEGAFLEPLKNWKTALPGNPNYVLDLITLLEICAINQHVAGLDNAEDELWYQALDQMAALVRDRIVKRVKEGAMVVLLNDAQRHYWFGMLEELGIITPKGRHGKKRKASKKTR